MYQNDTWIFGSATKSTFSVYAETVFSLSDCSALYDTLNDISEFSVILPKDTSSDWVLFAYPVDITSDCHACLCFVTHQSTLKNAMEKQHVFQNNLHEQYLLIKRQQLLLLLSSGYGKDNVGREILPDISFHGPYYCVLALRVTSSPKVGSNEICQLIEELSGEGLTFYTVDLKEEKCYAVLIGLDDEMRQDEVVELVGAVLEASGIHFSLGLGKLYQDIKHMSTSLTSALSACKTPHSNGLVRPNTKTAAGGKWYNDSSVIQMLAAIKIGNVEAAKAQLEIFFDETSISAPSLLIRYSIYADVINRLVQTSYEMELPLGKDYISTLLTTQDVFVLHDDMLVLISDLCEKYKEKMNSAAPKP